MCPLVYLFFSLKQLTNYSTLETGTGQGLCLFCLPYTNSTTG